MEIIISSSDEEDECDEKAASVPHIIVSLGVFLLSWQATFKVPDTCIAALLVFLCHFFSFVGTLTFSSQLTQFAQMLPRSVQQLRRVTGINVDTFTSYVVCPLCHSLYDYTNCIVGVGSRKEVRRCQHISFLIILRLFRKRC